MHKWIQHSFGMDNTHTHIPEFVYECTPTGRINGQPMKTDNTQKMKQAWNRLYITAVDNEDKVLAVV